MYDVTVEKEGFKSDTRKQVELRVGAVTRLNFTLEVGAVTQVLEVTGGAPLLETENAVVRTVVENKRIVEMPLNHVQMFDPGRFWGFLIIPAQASGV